MLADELTLALDVIVQRIYITASKENAKRFWHDDNISTPGICMLSVADRMAIMYASEMVEIGDIKSIFEELLHPYTRTLNTLPSCKKRNIHQRIHRTKRKRIKRIPIDKAVNTTIDALTSLRNASIEKSLY